MRKKLTLQCASCKKLYPYKLLLRCTDCSGIVDPVYDLRNFMLAESKSPLEHYFSLAPIEDSTSIIYLGEGQTPCVHATKLGKIFGLSKLFLKDETQNVTKSTKDRIATCVISQFKELDIKEFVACSTGNSSTALAYAVQGQEAMRLHLFCGRDFVHRHAYYDHPRIDLHVIDGNFVDAGFAAKEFALKRNIVLDGGFFSIAKREGLKLAYLEAFDQLPEQPSVVIQAVSSGMGLYGAYRGVQEYLQLGRLQNMPRLVGVQQDTCAPMVRAYEAHSPTIRSHDKVPYPKGLAEAILRGDPSEAYPYMYSIVTNSGGCFTAVSQDQIVQARTLLQETEGIEGCYSSATALAAARALRKHGWIRPDEVVLVNLTGGLRYR